MQIIPIHYQKNSLVIISQLEQADGLIWYHGGPDSTEQEWISAWPTAQHDYLGQNKIKSYTHEGTTRLNTADWFEFLKQQQPELPTAGRFAFTGGLAGHLTYDLGLELLKIESTRVELEYPLASVGLYHWAINIDHKSKRAFVVVQDSCPREIKRKIVDLTNNLELPSDQKRGVEGKSLEQLGNWTCITEKNAYKTAFDAIKHYIVEGDVYQVNLTRQWSSRSVIGSDIELYAKLTEEMPAPFSVFHRTKVHSLLSVSPERFIQIQNGQILTQPIKGTIARGKNTLEDEENIRTLSRSEKDLAENLMIVDLLRNDISKNAEPGSVKVDKLCEVHSFKNVHHLVSSITAALKQGSHPLDVLKDAFPGGSITGAPKKRAMEIIEELELVKRGNYCGCSFYLNSDNTLDSNILIRTITKLNDKLTCHGGGGIVFDSEVESEYHESDVKVRRILNAIAPS